MSILNWIEDKKRLKLLNAPKHVATSADSSKGLWTRCDKCGIILYIKHLKENQRVCFGCSYHLQMMSGERIESLLDKNPPSRAPLKRSAPVSGYKPVISTWRPLDETVSPCDPLRFYDQKRYRDRLQDAQERTGLQDAIQTGTGMIDGIPVALAVMDFSFMGGSMGSVVGEKITRLIEYATAEGLTLLIVSASGGARMQEGVFSLMQMAKISSALYLYQSCANLLYISILTSPTTGGVTASFAMLGDIIFAEPKALIAFAGRRVIEQTLSEDLPDDFQTSEYMLHHGLVDLIVPRRFLRQAISETIRLYQNAPFKKRGQIPFGVQNPISFLTEEKIRRNWDVLTRLSSSKDQTSKVPSLLRETPSSTTKDRLRPRAQTGYPTKQSFVKTSFDQRWGDETTSIFQREKSNPFGRYRKLLTSFEIMLDLFVSGNMVSGTNLTPSQIKDRRGRWLHHQDLCRSVSRNRSNSKGDTIFNTSLFGNGLSNGRDVVQSLSSSEKPISFWLYKGLFLPKQDTGKNRVERARLYNSRFSTKLETQGAYVTPKVSAKVKTLPYLRSCKSYTFTNRRFVCDGVGQMASPSRFVKGEEQNANGQKPRNATVRSLILINRNGVQRSPYKANRAKKAFHLRKLVNGVKQIALYKSAFSIFGVAFAKGAAVTNGQVLQIVSHTNRRFVKVLDLSSPSKSVLSTKSRYHQKNFFFVKKKVLQPVKVEEREHFSLSRREANRNGFESKISIELPFRKIGGAVCTGIHGKAHTKGDPLRGSKDDPLQEKSFFARSSRTEIDRVSLLHNFRVFSENGDLARNSVFGVSEVAFPPLSASRLCLSRAYAPQKSVKKETKTRSTGSSWSNRSAIGFKHTDYLCANPLCVGTIVANSVTPPSVKPLFSKVSRNTQFCKQNRKLTTKKDDINFLNQAIELAATEGVEWRAFYIYQQLSENTGFLEDFLQQSPSSREQSGNVLFYKSICRSEKALSRIKTL